MKLEIKLRIRSILLMVAIAIAVISILVSILFPEEMYANGLKLWGIWPLFVSINFIFAIIFIQVPYFVTNRDRIKANILEWNKIIMGLYFVLNAVIYPIGYPKFIYFVVCELLFLGVALILFGILGGDHFIKSKIMKHD